MSLLALKIPHWTTSNPGKLRLYTVRVMMMWVIRSPNIPSQIRLRVRRVKEDVGTESTPYTWTSFKKLTNCHAKYLPRIRETKKWNLWRILTSSLKCVEESVIRGKYFFLVTLYTFMSLLCVEYQTYSSWRHVIATSPHCYHTSAVGSVMVFAMTRVFLCLSTGEKKQTKKDC